MATTRAIRKIKVGLPEIGFVNMLSDVSVEFTGDPEMANAIEGTVGIIKPAEKGMRVTGSIWIPAEDTAEYTKILDFWFGDKELSMTVFFGAKRAKAEGMFNAPSISDDGTKISFEFNGHDVIWPA